MCKTSDQMRDPLTMVQKKMLFISSMQIDLSFSKLFEICKSDTFWQMLYRFGPPYTTVYCNHQNYGLEHCNLGNFIEFVKKIGAQAPLWLHYFCSMRQPQTSFKTINYGTNKMPCHGLVDTFSVNSGPILMGIFIYEMNWPK